MEIVRTLDDLDMMEGGEGEDFEEDVRRKFYIMMPLERRFRMKNADRTRFRWKERVEELTDGQFRRIYRMSRESFDILLGRIEGNFQKDERWALNGGSGVAAPHLRLSMTLGFLAGGSYLTSHGCMECIKVHSMP